MTRLFASLLLVFAGVAAAQNSNPLPMPHPKALELADSRCDDLAFSANNKKLGEACKRDNHRGFDELSSLRNDPEIRIDFWAACQDAVGFRASANYLGWAQCARFVRTSCPASSVASDDDKRRCLRAIQSGGWILNSSVR
ncbi:hypothetical protein [Ralstonia mannitolilytica]|uniref:hypothetical protein n=1 Tax=Ralstonia mannitolilytica TaxID=105219 RepID=UPI00292CC84D|nr:hypothetical protein [Ralstonia mannitolilytica]